MGRRNRNRGFSLVELMVGLVVGLIVIASVIAVFIGSRQTYQEIQRVTRLQENLRFATDFMTRDIRRAGYNLVAWGDLSPTDETGTGFGPGSFMIQWLADDGDRDCIGEEVAAGTAIQHVYAVIDEALTCTRDGVTTVLVRDVTGMQRDLVSTTAATPEPIGISVTLIYRTAVANETFAHETEFLVAFRNEILDTIETP